jgi:hypothetical protein
MRKLLLAALLALLCADPAAAAGSGTAQSFQKSWQKADLCAKKSFEIYPDYTEEQIAKRNIYVRKCQMEQGLPQSQEIPIQAPAAAR